MNATRSSGLTRRSFLQVAGGATGMVAVAPLSPLQRALGTPRPTSVRVGLLLPSGGDGRMVAGLRAGLGLGLGEASSWLTATTSVEEVLHGYSGVYAAARRLLDEQEVDVVVAGVTAPVAHQIAPLFKGRQVPLLVANVGAHWVKPAHHNPYVLHAGLQYWQASFALGRWAAANAGSRAVVAASRADSGYDAVYAFKQGFESAGGRVVSQVVTHISPEHAGFGDVFEAVSDARADLLFGLYSGQLATQFVREYARSGLRTPLLAGGFAVDEALLPAHGSAALGIRSAFSWSPELASRANRAFAETYQAAAGQAPDTFAVLGYDAARLLATGISRAVASGGKPRNLIAALSGARVASPRGDLRVDARSNSVQAPIYIREVRSVAGRPANAIVDRADAVRAYPVELAALSTEPVSSYFNEYLFA